MSTAMQLLFLPGASGNSQFWKPLADQLDHPGERYFVRYPGFGDMPADGLINSLEDLSQQIAGYIDKPTAIFAQSMGGHSCYQFSHAVSLPYYASGAQCYLWWH